MFVLEYGQPPFTGSHYGENAVQARVFLHRVERANERMLRKRLFSFTALVRAFEGSVMINDFWD